MVAWEISVQEMTVWKEDTMRLCFYAAFLFSFFHFSLSAAYADEQSEAREFFIVQCMGCHAFSCNKVRSQTRRPHWSESSRSQ